MSGDAVWMMELCAFHAQNARINAPMPCEGWLMLVCVVFSASKRFALSKMYINSNYGQAGLDQNAFLFRFAMVLAATEESL